MRRQEFDASFDGSRISARRSYIKTAFIFEALGNSVSMWQRRDPLPLSLALPFDSSAASLFTNTWARARAHGRALTRPTRNHPAFP